MLISNSLPRLPAAAHVDDPHRPAGRVGAARDRAARRGADRASSSPAPPASWAGSSRSPRGDQSPAGRCSSAQSEICSSAGIEGLPAHRQRVGHGHRRALADGPRHEAGRGQLGQALGEHRVADPVDRARQLAEARGPGAKAPEHDAGPALAQHGEAAGERDVGAAAAGHVVLRRAWRRCGHGSMLAPPSSLRFS